MLEKFARSCFFHIFNPMNYSPAVLQAFQKPVMIDMFASEEEGQDRQQIIMQHAMAVIQHYQNLNVSAMQMCIHLFLCREEFKASGETGWEQFCATNFESYGLSQSNIRHSIRTGRSLLSLIRRVESAGEKMPDLSVLSRSALLVLADAPPDVQDRMVIEMGEQLAEEAQNKGPTAEELRRKLEEMEGELKETKAEVETKNKALHRLNQAIDARETEIMAEKEKVKQLTRKLATPVEHVVHKLPDGIKTEMEAKERLGEEIAFRQRELARLEEDAARLKAEKTRYESEMAAKRQAKDVLEALNADIQAMMTKYTDALMQKLSSTDPENVTPLLTSAAQRLRILANQLSPSLV